MPAYSFYKLDSGEILPDAASCPESWISGMIPAGCGVLSGHHDHTRDVVVHADDGFGNTTKTVVRRAPAMPPATSSTDWELCEETLTWHPVATLDGAKSGCWERIKFARNSAANAPTILVGGNVWQVCPASISAIRAQLEVADAVGSTWSTVWTFADNSRDTVSAADLRAVLLAVGLRAGAAHQRAEALRARIDAAVSVAEINSINWASETP